MCDLCGAAMGFQASRGGAFYYCPNNHEPAGPDVLRLVAYGYEITIQPFHESGQWIAEIDGALHCYED
jgi:hypothetical protein